MSKEDQIKLWCKVRLSELMGGIGDNDAKTVLKELLDFIDNDPFAKSAPQAPELSKVERTGKECKEQLASDDLEKEMQHYLCKEWAGDPIILARHFSEWQKQQMMKDAVDGCCISNGKEVGSAINSPIGMVFLKYNKFNVGDKVKVIIIKED